MHSSSFTLILIHSGLVLLIKTSGITASLDDCTEGYVPLCSLHDCLFTYTFTYVFFNIQPRTSDAVACLQVSPVLGVVLVEFANGYSYEYTGVSRRAIANLMLNPNMSLGFWVNQNCIRPERTACLTLV